MNPKGLRAYLQQLLYPGWQNIAWRDLCCLSGFKKICQRCHNVKRIFLIVLRTGAYLLSKKSRPSALRLVLGNGATSGCWSKALQSVSTFWQAPWKDGEWGPASDLMETLPCGWPDACQHCWWTVLTLVESSGKKQRVRIMHRALCSPSSKARWNVKLCRCTVSEAGFPPRRSLTRGFECQ